MVLVETGDEDFVGLSAHVGDARQVRGGAAAFPVERLVVEVDKVVHVEALVAVDMQHGEPGAALELFRHVLKVGHDELAVLLGGDQRRAGELRGHEDAVDALVDKRIEEVVVGLLQRLERVRERLRVGAHELEGPVGVHRRGKLLYPRQRVEQRREHRLFAFVGVDDAPVDGDLGGERVVRRVECSELVGVLGRGDRMRMEDAVPLLRVCGELIVGAICDRHIVSAGHNLDEIPMSSGCRVDGFSVEIVGDRVCQGEMEPSYDRELFPELLRLDLLLDQFESSWHQCPFPRYPENRYE